MPKITKQGRLPLKYGNGDYIAKHPLPEDDFRMRVSIRVMAQMVAGEVVRFQVIEA